MRSFKKSGEQSIGRSRGGNTTKIHVLSADEKTPVALSLSAGHNHDAPCGRKLLNDYGKVQDLALIADRAYEGDETRNLALSYEGDKTRNLALSLGYKLCIPPKFNRKIPWYYDKELYKSRNEIERLFRRVKEYRRVFTRYVKLDVMYMGFVLFGFIVEALRLV